MDPLQQSYRRLPGVKRSPIRKATLWLAADHILSIDSNRFTEDYKRYYFKDIQAIIVRQTTGTTAIGKALDVAFAIALALLAFTAWRIPSRGAAIVAGLLLIGYLLFRAPGPFCTCHLITAVSQDRLPSLKRLRNAEKTLRILQPLIEEAQREEAP